LKASFLFFDIQANENAFTWFSVTAELTSISKSMNLDLQPLVTWLNANEITLNATKTELMLFCP